MKFQVNDTVQFKAGGPYMLISAMKLDEQEQPVLAVCRFWDGSKFAEEEFEFEPQLEKSPTIPKNLAKNRKCKIT
jgi:uncharacterized protein YodC (DUF2158 family)